MKHWRGNRGGSRKTLGPILEFIPTSTQLQINTLEKSFKKKQTKTLKTEQKQLHIHYCSLPLNANIDMFYRAAIVPHDIINRDSKISVCTQEGGLTKSQH